MPASLDRGASAPRLLALDTSTETLVAALVQGDAVHAHEEAGGSLASVRLMPAIDELLTRAGWTLPSLDAIAFAQGPGAFTGLRTAVAAAQGLALGLGRPTLSVDSLMIVAEAGRLAHHDGMKTHPATETRDGASASASSGDTLCVRVLMDARMDEVYDGLYEWQEASHGWRVLEPASLRAPAAVASSWASLPQRVDLVVGSALLTLGDRLAIPASFPTSLSTLAQPTGRARALARLAQQAWREGRLQDAAQALPVYVRNKVALTTVERAVAAAPQGPVSAA